MRDSIFDAYCYYVLSQSNAPQGRYRKEDLQQHVMKLPHAQITLVARDMLVEEVPILPDDGTLLEWVEGEVVDVAFTRPPWAPKPFFLSIRRLLNLRPGENANGLAHWPEWTTLDSNYMPLGLEPVLMAGPSYSLDEQMFRMCDIRFLPLKSYEYRKV